MSMFVYALVCNLGSLNGDSRADPFLIVYYMCKNGNFLTSILEFLCVDLERVVFCFHFAFCLDDGNYVVQSRSFVGC